MSITLSPAYGRDYTSKAAVKADWDADKDFVVETFGPDSGRYANRADLKGQEVWIRYAKLTKTVQV